MIRKSACLLGVWIAAISAGSKTVSYRIEAELSLGRSFSASAMGGKAVINRYMEFEGELRLTLKMEAGEEDAEPVRGCMQISVRDDIINSELASITP